MYTLEQYDDYHYSFIVCKDGTKIMQVDANWHQLKAFVDAANAGLEAMTDTDPMSPDYAALSQHKPQSQVADSRDAAGLGGGEPFTPTITTLPRRVHGHEEGCECSTCKNIQEAFANGDALRQVETF